MKVKDYKELKVWQKGIDIVDRIYGVTEEFFNKHGVCEFSSGVIARSVFCDEAILGISKRLLRPKSRLAMTRNLHIAYKL